MADTGERLMLEDDTPQLVELRGRVGLNPSQTQLIRDAFYLGWEELVTYAQHSVREVWPAYGITVSDAVAQLAVAAALPPFSRAYIRIDERAPDMLSAVCSLPDSLLQA